MLLALCLTASGLTWAGWWGHPAVSRKAEPYGALPPATPAPAPPSPQSFSPANPSKEYVYAGGRLVATEEPTQAPLLNQTITFAQPPDKTYGDEDFALSASASSGLGVGFAAAGNCTVSGSIVHITGAGSCTVTASQAGNANYNAAPDVARTFAAAKAASTTSVTAADATYDGQPHGAAAVVTGVGGLNQGLAVSYGGRNGTAYGPTPTAPTNAGDYTASASYGGGANHLGSSGGKDFRVLKAAATLNLSGLTGRVYNGSPQAVTVATTPAGLSGVAVTYNGSSTAPTAAGSYAVVATLTHQNYSAAAASGTMVVARATPAITWPNPADIAEGTPLGPAQLNAAANVPGTFAYTPPAGTILGVGNGQQLSALFTPTNASNYNTNTAAVLINVVGCPKAARSTFTASPESVLRGESTTLSWNVPYASNVFITPVGNFPGPTGSTVASPPATMSYGLTATGSALCPALSMQKLVTVCPNPAQAEFTAYPRTINPGGSSQLRWKGIPDVRSIVIDGLGTFGPVNDNWGSTRPSPTSPYTVHSAAADLIWPPARPAATTTYTMHAIGDAGCTPVTKQATVTVGACPTEADVTFTLDSAGLTWQAPAGSTVRLGYVDNCSNVGGPACEAGWVIDQTFGAGGSIAPPGTNRTLYYTLEAEDAQGCVVQTSVGVQGGSGLPACGADASFSADPSWYNRMHQDYTLTWSVPGATQVEIEKVGGGSAGAGSGPDFEYIGEVYGTYGASGNMSLQLPGPTGFRLKATTAGGGGTPSRCEMYAAVDGPAIYGGSAGVRTPADEGGWWADLLRLWLTVSL